MIRLRALLPSRVRSSQYIDEWIETECVYNLFSSIPVISVTSALRTNQGNVNELLQARFLLGCMRHGGNEKNYWGVISMWMQSLLSLWPEWWFISFSMLLLIIFQEKEEAFGDWFCSLPKSPRLEARIEDDLHCFLKYISLKLHEHPSVIFSIRMSA